MPTRIKPDRIGYSGYTCVGIPRPCINPMDDVDNRFECLPKETRNLITDVPYEDLGEISLDLTVQAELQSCNTHYDPLNGGVFVDLYNAFKRKGLDSYLNFDCIYVYKRNAPKGSEEFPIDPESKLQVVYDPGYMDPPAIIIPGVGDMINCCELGSSSGSSQEFSSEYSSEEVSSAASSAESSEEPSSEEPSSEVPPSEPSSEEPPSEEPPSSECPGEMLWVVTDVYMDSQENQWQQKTQIWVNCIGTQEDFPVFTTTDCE